MDKNNYQAWKLRISNFLMGKGYWDFITKDEQGPILPYTPTVAQVQALKSWHERYKKVMFCLSISISNAMIVHIHNAEMPKEAWNTLSKL